MHIVLIDPNLAGHRLMYFYEYAKLLAEMNHRVSVISGDEEKCRRYFDQCGAISGISFFPFVKEVSEIKWLSKYEFYPHLLLLKRIRQSLKLVKDVNMLFLMYLDFFVFDFNEPAFQSRGMNGFMNRYVLPFMVDHYIDKPWCGILFHPAFLNHKESRYFFSSRNCRAVAMLDEYWKDEGLTIVKTVIPDITDTYCAEELTPVAAEVRRRAGDRKVISLLGSLEMRKGLGPLLATIPSLPPDKYFFILSGKADPSLPEQVKNDILLVRNRENCYVNSEGIASETEFNDMVRISDLIYLVYNNFPHSSNLLTKAAFFKKPVLATGNGCIGNRVLKYQLGVTMKDDHPETISRTILRFNELYDIKNGLFIEYSMAHSKDRLKEVLRRIIGDL